LGPSACPDAYMHMLVLSMTLVSILWTFWTEPYKLTSLPM